MGIPCFSMLIYNKIQPCLPIVIYYRVVDQVHKKSSCYNLLGRRSDAHSCLLIVICYRVVDPMNASYPVPSVLNGFLSGYPVPHHFGTLKDSGSERYPVLYCYEILQGKGSGRDHVPYHNRILQDRVSGRFPFPYHKRKERVLDLIDTQCLPKVV